MLRIAQMIRPEETPNLSALVPAPSTPPRQSADGSILSAYEKPVRSEFQNKQFHPGLSPPPVRKPLAQRVFGLHHGDRVRKPFQIFGETSLVSSTEEPLRKSVRIVGWQVRIFGIPRQLNDRLRTQHAIQVLVQKNLGNPLQ